MKKFLAVFMLAAMLMGMMAFTAWAAGTAYLSGPSVVRAGDTIKISFAAGGDDVRGGSGKWSYDSSQLTLVSFSSGLSGEWNTEFDEGKKTFFFYHNKGSAGPAMSSTKTIITATFQVSGDLAPGTEVSVSASYTLSEGSKDIANSSSRYSVTIAEPLSNNAMLAALTVSNASISPAFSPDVTDYTAAVPFSTDYLQVSAEAEHKGAQVKVTGASLSANTTTAVKVTVTAEDGTVRVYTIRTWRDQDPNYVPSDVNTLDSLEAGTFLLSPLFSPEKTSYAVYVPYETTGMEFQAQKTHSLSKVQMPHEVMLPVGESTYEIQVTAENGQVRSYFVTVFRAEPFGVEAPEETEPVQPTVDETEPTEPIQETTEPIQEPEDPQISEPEQGMLPWWYLPIAAVAGFALGAALLLLKKKKA